MPGTPSGEAEAVEYVAGVLGERTFNAPTSKEHGTLLVAQGKFNTKKFHDGMDELARDFGFTKEGEGRSLIYQFGGPGIGGDPPDLPDPTNLPGGGIARFKK